MNITNVTISWSVSKGRDTYGYNICRLDDTSTRKRYRCNGGGYDMVGTVFAEWLTDVHQDSLSAIADKAHYDYRTKTTKEDGLYGMHVSGSGKVHLQGACGIESMLRIAKAIGLEVQRTWDRKGNTTGYLIGGPE